MSGSGPRAQVRLWINEQIKGQSEVNVPEIAKGVIEHFKGDEEFIAAFFDEMLYPIAYDTVIDVVKRTRGAANVVQLGDEMVGRDEVKQRGKRLSSRWNSWLEHVGDKHVRLMDMTKTDCVAAKILRTDRGEHELRIAALFDALAVRLEDSQKVKDAFTPQEIEKIWKSLDKAVA